MKRRQNDDGLDRLSDLYRSNPNPSRDIDMEAYKRTIQEADEKFGKYDEVGNNKYRNKPVDATILEWKEEVKRIEDRQKGMPTKSWDADDF